MSTFVVVHSVFSLPTTASPTLQGTLKDGFGEAVMACNIPEPCKFPSLNSCQVPVDPQGKEVYLAPHPAIGLVFQVGDTEKFPHAVGFKSLDHFSFLFFRVSKQGPCFSAVEEDGRDKRLVELEPACKADGVAPPDPL